MASAEMDGSLMDVFSFPFDRRALVHPYQLQQVQYRARPVSRSERRQSTANSDIQVDLSVGSRGNMTAVRCGDISTKVKENPSQGLYRG